MQRVFMMNLLVNNKYLRAATPREKAVDETASLRAENQSLISYLFQAREDERKALAREMHDELGQILTAIDLELHSLLRMHTEMGIDIQKRIRCLLDLSAIATSSIHRIASNLRPAILDRLGLGAAIEWLAKEYERGEAFATRLDVDIMEEKVGERTATALFRIAQEALTNAARHARSSLVEVTLRQSPREIVLEIRDDGVGIGPERAASPDSFGLIGIRERAFELGGEALIAGESGQGTRLFVSIPALPEGGFR
jgi:signal transduction histidine kinase